MDNTLTQLKKIRVDSLYGKKKHFNAANRKSRYHMLIGISLICLSTISGSVLFYVIVKSNSNISWVPLLISVITFFLSGIQTFFNFSKQAEGHRGIGNRYLAIMKKSELLISLYNDKQLKKEELATKALELSDETEKVNRDSEAFSTNKKDYKMAQEGIEQGEESYTEKELSAWGKKDGGFR